MLIAKFMYNNAKNANTNYKLFEMNYKNLLQMFFKKNKDYCSGFKIASKLVVESQMLLAVCRRIFTTPKNSKSKPGIKSLSLAILRKIIKFG